MVKSIVGVIVGYIVMVILQIDRRREITPGCFFSDRLSARWAW
jgi:hypothetical protein